MTNFTYRGVSLDSQTQTMVVEITKDEWAEINERVAPRIVARVRAEMEACPFVACECGYHHCCDDD